MSQPTTLLNEEESAWVAQLAARLQLIRTDAATGTAGQRREYFQEEIDRSLKTVPAANRKRLLSALLARFPVAGQIVTVAAAPAPTPPVVEETLEQLLSRFLTAAAEAPEERRAELARALFASDFAKSCRPPAPPSSTTAVAEELQKSLGLAAGQQPRPERLAQIAAQSIDLLCALHQSARKTLAELAPRSELLRRIEDLRKPVGQFLCGEAESVEAQMRAHVGLLGALLVAMQQGGREFEREHNSKFSPDRIADVVDAEGGGGFMGPNRKERCWRKYEDLAEDYVKPGYIDRRIKECLGTAAEKAGRGGR